MSSISLVVAPAPSGYRTDRQTDRHIDRQTDRQTDGQTDRENREKVINSTEIQTAVFQHLYV